MCFSGGGGGGGGSPMYTALDGTVHADPNMAEDRNRALNLAAIFGLDKTTIRQQTADAKWADPILYWRAHLAKPEDLAKFDEYNNQGLTAADYRAESRIAEQEAKAKQAEDARKAAIATGRGSVDSAFSSFDDNYFDGIAKSVKDYYTPQLDSQFNDANEQFTFRLARQGLLKSDTAEQGRAKMKGKYDLERGSIVNRAMDAVSQARENVSAAKNSLYNYAEVAADPAAVDTRLAAETGRIRSYQPELTPMAQVFTDWLSPIGQTIATGLAAEARGYPGFGTGIFDNRSGAPRDERVGGR